MKLKKILLHIYLYFSKHRDGTSAIERAIAANDAATLRRYFDGGIRASDQMLFHVDVDYDSREILSILLKHGVNINSCNSHGENLLHIVQDIPTIQFLIEHGIDIKSRDAEGNNALFFVEKLELSKILQEAGVDCGAVNNLGETPLHTIIDEDVSYELVDLFIQNGVNINQLDNDGHTVLDYALAFNNDKVANLLKKSGGYENKRPLLYKTEISWTGTVKFIPAE